MFAKWRFQRALRKAATSDITALRIYSKAEWPAIGTPARYADLLALDFELDGLRKNADLLQAGWVPFDSHSISLAGANSIDIQSKTLLDDSAVAIHGIGEQRALVGTPIEDVLPHLLESLAGRVLIAHAAWIETQALQRACKSVFGLTIPVRSICTLALERSIHPGLTDADAYRLGASRKRYGLPEYSAHDALTDAISAAELFQAQLSRLPAQVSLKQLERGV